MVLAASIMIGLLILGLGLSLATERSARRPEIIMDEPEPELKLEPEFKQAEPEAEPEAKPDLELELAEALAPMFASDKPSKQPLGIYTWSVRKQIDSELYAVLPIDKNGKPLWRQAVATDIADPLAAWSLANVGRQALRWVE